MRNLVKGIVLAGVAALSAVALLPGTALALGEVECGSWDADSCTTGAIAANPKTHALWMYVDAWYGADRATCVVWDNHTWVEVGRLTTSNSSSKEIKGLYGTYVMGCYSSNKQGEAHGKLSSL